MKCQPQSVEESRGLEQDDVPYQIDRNKTFEGNTIFSEISMMYCYTLLHQLISKIHKRANRERKLNYEYTSSERKHISSEHCLLSSTHLPNQPAKWYGILQSYQ